MNFVEHVSERRIRCLRLGLARLEVLFTIAVLSLAFQLFPVLGNRILYAVDVRNWGQMGWMLFNAVLIVGLLVVRFGPELVAGARGGHRLGRLSRRNKSTIVTDSTSDWRELDERSQRELFQRMQEARKKQVI
jgi:hypothetical protein